MKRDIITIDPKKCNGCGACVPNCPEGALQIIEGKAYLVSDLLCDGLGACIGRCPQGAIHIEKKEAEPYDERKAVANVAKVGPAVIKAHLKHLKDHGQTVYLKEALDYLKEHKMSIPDFKHEEKSACGCPGSQAKSIRHHAEKQGEGAVPVKVQSELRSWPVQLHLLNPNAPYLKNADLVVAADCSAFAYANFHAKFLKDKVLTIFCPKLDKSNEVYVEKLAEIFKNNDTPSVTIVRMEVPCCAIEQLVAEAVKRSGKPVIMKEYTVSIEGELV